MDVIKISLNDLRILLNYVERTLNVEKKTLEKSNVDEKVAHYMRLKAGDAEESINRVKEQLNSKKINIRN